MVNFGSSNGGKLSVDWRSRGSLEASSPGETVFAGSSRRFQGPEALEEADGVEQVGIGAGAREEDVDGAGIGTAGAEDADGAGIGTAGAG